MRDRRSQRTAEGQTYGKAWDDRVMGASQVQVTPAFRYADGYARTGVVANDPDPNTSEPERILPGGSISKLAVYPIVGLAPQPITLAVWARRDDRASTDVPGWIRLRTIDFQCDGTDVETSVDVGFRDTAVTLEDGADAGHPAGYCVASC